MTSSVGSFMTSASSFDAGLSKLVVSRDFTLRVNGGCVSSTGQHTASLSRRAAITLPLSRVSSVHEGYGYASFHEGALPYASPVKLSFASPNIRSVRHRDSAGNSFREAKSEELGTPPPADKSFSFASTPSEDPRTPPRRLSAVHASFTSLPRRFAVGGSGKENESTKHVSRKAGSTRVLTDRTNMQASSMQPSTFLSTKRPGAQTHESFVSQASFRQIAQHPLASQTSFSQISPRQQTSFSQISPRKALLSVPNGQVRPTASFMQRSPTWPAARFASPSPPETMDVTLLRNCRPTLAAPRAVSHCRPQAATFSVTRPIGLARPAIASWNTILPAAPDGVDERLWVMSHVCPPGDPDEESSPDGKVQGDTEERINYWRAKGGDMLRSMGVPQNTVRGAGLI